VRWWGSNAVVAVEEQREDEEVYLLGFYVLVVR
jgi:hypothetical protein